MPGLREQKKQATREALREAALRLAMTCGPENVRVDDIAEAAGVSPRTYNNYFSSREQAIVAAITTEREARVATAVAAAPDRPLSEAVVEAIVEQYTTPDRDPLALITTSPSLRAAFVNTASEIEPPLTAAITARVGDEHTARVLAASVAAAVRIALERWLAAFSVERSGLVVPTGSLPDLLRASLTPLVPALDDSARKSSDPAVN